MSCGSAAEPIIQNQLIFKERGRQIISVLLMLKRLMDVIDMCRYLNKQVIYMRITSRGKCLTLVC